MPVNKELREKGYRFIVYRLSVRSKIVKLSLPYAVLQVFLSILGELVYAIVNKQWFFVVITFH